MSLPNPNDSPASTEVVHAVANATGRDPLNLPPLYEVLDPSALDALVFSGQDGRDSESGALELRFRYAGVDIHVRKNGDVHAEVDGNEP